MTLNQTIDGIASHIQNTENQRKHFSLLIQSLRTVDLKNFQSPEFLEKVLVHQIPKQELNETIAGVDSGFVGKNFSFMDLVFIRTVGVVFEYEKNKLKKSNYFPNFFSFPQPFASFDGREREEFGKSVSINRLKQEISTASKLIQEYSPHFCFIDGSIVPQPADKPGDDSSIKPSYQEMLKEFEHLYDTANEKNCIILGTVEDSHGTRFKEIFDSTILPSLNLPPSQNPFQNTTDSIFLNYFLKAGERTTVFRYTRDAQKHPILRDFNSKFSQQVCAFYIKASQYDFPLRVEFLNGHLNVEEFANKIAAVVLAQASTHKEYSFPAILIEADLRARLRPEEIQLVEDKIFTKIGRHSIFFQRRDRRPF